MSHATFSLSRAVQRLYWTKMYPNALIFLSPLSGPHEAPFPHAFLNPDPPPPNPIKESGVWQSPSWLAMIPIRTRDWTLLLTRELKPSWLQLRWREALGPISFFHASRPSEVARYWLSPMRAYNESAFWCSGKNLVTPSTFMPRQILEKDVLQ